MRPSFAAIAFSWFLLGCFTATGTSAEPPNIVLLYAGDQSASMMGSEGNSPVKTPHLSQLASEGACFSRHYVVTPQDAPSRACVLTGQYPHTHGVTTDDLPLSAGADTVTARLKKAGYLCGFVGPWDLNRGHAAEPGYGFTDYVAASSRPWSWENSDVWVQGTKGKADKYLDDWIADRAIEFLDKPREKPFFLWVSFVAPHEPLAYPPGTEALYPPAAIELPKKMPMDAHGRSTMLNTAPLVKEFAKMTEPQLREARSKYAAMITQVDTNVGRILARIDERKLRENTVVVFSSCSGMALGDHALYGTGPAFYEELIRVPLLVRYPARAKAGLKVDRISSVVDLTPTLLELAGLAVPITMQGRSLLPLLDNPDTARHADEGFLEYDRQGNYVCEVHGMVTRQFKYIDYAAGGDEFYDLKRDPAERHNAVSDVEYKAVVDVMKSRLQRWREETKDPKLKR